MSSEGIESVKSESSESVKENVEQTEETTAFLALEKDYHAVLAELQQNEGLSNFSTEFTRLFEALYASHCNEERLMEKCQDLQTQLAANAAKVAIAIKLQTSDKETIEQLKQELETAWKQIDAAHARELNAQEMIEHFRAEIARLNFEIEQKAKLGLDQADDFGVVNKKKDAQARERERLLDDLARYKEQLEKLLVTQENLEHSNTDAEMRINELTQELEASERLHALQMEMKKPCHELIQSVDTRWGSEFQMLARLIEQREPISAELTNSRKIDNLAIAEWDLINEYVTYLEPLHQATTEMCGDTYPTMSMVIPVLTGALNVIDTLINENVHGHSGPSRLVGISFGRELRKALMSRFPLFKTNKEYLLAMVMDHRYKCVLLDANGRSVAKNFLKQEIALNTNHEADHHRPTEPVNENVSRRGLSLWDKVDDMSTQEEDQRIISVEDEISMYLKSLATESSKEAKAKERVESELRDTQAEVESKEADVVQLNYQLQQANKSIAKLEALFKEAKIANDRLTRESETLKGRLDKAKLDYEAQCNLNEKIVNESTAQASELKVREEEIARMKNETQRVQRMHDNLEKKMRNIEAQRTDMEVEREKLKMQVSTQEKELELARKQTEADARALENMVRERELLSKNVVKAANTAHDQMKLLKLQEFVKKKLELEIDQYMGEANKQRKAISHLEKERDLLTAESMELTQKVQDTVDEVKLKQMAIFEYKKKIAEGDTKFRMQQNLFEQVRADRNMFSKNLLEAQDEITELKHKLKVTGHQVEQLKEDITTKETQLIREEHALQKAEKDKENLKVEVQKLNQDIAEFKREIHEMQQEENKMRKIIKAADEEKMRQKKDMEQIMNERDILGTQLVRRNDELSLLYEKIKILQSTLHKGEAQYDQRLEDIRLLKLEIKGLRQEKAMLCKNVTNMADLRQEVLHLERDLTRESLKCRALEEELQNPLNIHRWRKLEGSDPGTYELIQKIQLLQKRLMAQSSAAIAREQQLQDSERLYMNLRQMLVRQPGPDTALRLSRTQQALKDRGVKMRSLIAELNMYESQVSEYKTDLERVNQEMKELKEKFFEQKRREHKQKEKEQAALPVAKSSSGSADSRSRFTGGGFNLNATPARAQSVTNAPSNA